MKGWPRSTTRTKKLRATSWVKSLFRLGGSEALAASPLRPRQLARLLTIPANDTPSNFPFASIGPHIGRDTTRRESRI